MFFLNFFSRWLRCFHCEQLYNNRASSVCSVQYVANNRSRLVYCCVAIPSFARTWLSLNVPSKLLQHHQRRAVLLIGVHTEPAAILCQAMTVSARRQHYRNVLRRAPNSQASTMKQRIPSLPANCKLSIEIIEYIKRSLEERAACLHRFRSYFTCPDSSCWHRYRPIFS